MPRSKPPRHPRPGPRKPAKPATRGLPSREQVLEFIKDSAAPVGKREIARAFGVESQDRVALKRLLKEIESEGAVARGRKRRLADPEALPEMIVLQITGLDPDGEVLARPLEWEEAVELPHIVVAPDRQGVPALSRGDRILARLRRVGGKTYEARAVRFLGNQPLKVLGVFEEAGWGGRGRVVPTDKRAKQEYVIEPEDRGEARPGDIVWIEPVGAKGRATRARILERLGSMAEPRTVSLIAIAAHDIPVDFSPEARRQAERSKAAPMGERVDLRAVPLVTIDGEDARDFDDAVFAEPDDDPANRGGWKLIVAIADVAWYVRPDDALDRSAVRRGNSVYFPDRVVPMLPEELSNGWCSLRPREDRPVLATHMRIDPEGRLLSHRFVRGMMHSAARLTYNQVQAAYDGQPDDVTGPLIDKVIKPLYGAYRVLLAARDKRGAIDLDLPERKTVIDEKGRIVDIAPRERLDSHKLIEEFMICANVAAAQALESRRMPCMYRVHEPPDPLKIEALREFLDSLDIPFAGGRLVQPGDFNRVLQKIAGTPQALMINQMILRSQSQAVYAPDNLGHFGLALQRYAHFTSPIRRYADLLVHRALIAGYGMGEGGLPKEAGQDFPELGVTISGLERKAIAAERDATDRYVALFLADRVGASFSGRINGVTRFGLFVTLDETGADGLVPISSLGREYFEHDERRHCLTGRSTGITYYLGDRVRVKLAEAEPITGGLVFEMEAVVESFGQASVPVGRSARKPGNRRDKARKPARAGFKRRGGTKRR
jgi:ribonuclease R